MDKYLTCYKVYFKNYIVYPSNVFIKLIYVPIQMIIVYYLWKILSQYKYIDMNYMFNYYLLTYLILYSYPFLNISSDIQNDIFSGSLSNYMVRPINYIIPKLARFLAWMSIYCVILIPALFYVSIIRNIGLLKILQFTVLMFLGIMIEFYLWYIIGILSFYIEKVRGLMRMINALRSLLSGSILPLSYFPKWSSAIIEFSPFRFLIYTPINFLLTTHGDFFPTMVSSLICLCILIILEVLLWNYGFQKYQNNLS